MKSKSPPQQKPTAPRTSARSTQPGRSEGGGGDRAYSVNALSKLLGADRRTIDKAVAHLPSVDGKYRLEDVEAALKEKKNSKLRDRKLLEEIRKLRIANDLAEGKVVEKTKVADAVRNCLGRLPAMIEQRLLNEYPAAAAGKSAPEIREQGRKLYDEIVAGFRELEVLWPK
jgi:hypothetical protein